MFGVFSVIFIFIGMTGLFFEHRYHYKILYLIFSLAGYVLIMLNFYLRINRMNEKELESRSSQKENNI